VNNIAANKFELIISNMPARGKRGWVRQGDTFLSAREKHELTTALGDVDAVKRIKELLNKPGSETSSKQLSWGDVKFTHSNIRQH